MPEYRDQTFHNRTLILDGQCYLGCRFINADLRYKGTAPFEMQGSRFEGYFNLEWDRQGADALAMVQMLDREVLGCGFDLDLASRLARWSGRVWRFHTLLPRPKEPGRAFDVDTAHRFGGRPHASPTDCVTKGCVKDV